MKFRRWFLRISIPIQKVLQKIQRPPYKVKGMFYKKLAEKAKNGDLVCSRCDWHLTNYLIPGFWKHCGMIFNDFVIEVTDERGVVATPLSEWTLSKDYVILRRPPGLESAGLIAEELVGKRTGYDYVFSKHNRVFCCNELLEYCYRRVSSAFKVHRRHVSWTTVPNDLATSSHFVTVMDSREFGVRNPYEGK